jgi:Trypsin-like peptidase domain
MKRYFFYLMLALTTRWAVAQAAPAATSPESTKIKSRIESFKELPEETKTKLSEDFQRESKEHFGFVAIKSVDEASAVDLFRLPTTQLDLLNRTSMHVVDGNLIPVAVLQGAIKPTGNQIYPDLQSLIATSNTPEMVALTAKVGRIRYWIRNGQNSGTLQDDAGFLAGTGFVVGTGMIATACHVLDYFTDESSVNLSPNVWVKIDLSPDAQTHETYAITGVLGKGSLQGQDYAILSVAKMSEDGTHSLPDSVTFGANNNAKYVGVIGYPDIAGAVKACGTGGSGCDETNKWFSNFASKNQGIIKIISPGRKTGDFNLHGFPILTYDAPTLGGQSGSPVIDLQSKTVIGLHYCCTGYKPSMNEPACAKLQPISLGDKSDNEALSIQSIDIPK